MSKILGVLSVALACACAPDNPCLTNNGGCDPNSTCSEDSNYNPVCTCNSGYVASSDGTTCVTACSVANCDPNATCDASSGTAVCSCTSGFTGDGTTCTATDPCTTANCDPNATCDSSSGTAVCTCNTGFTGDGTTCSPDLSGAYSGTITEVFTCNSATPPQGGYALQDTYTIAQSGTSATITLTSCPTDTLSGNVSGEDIAIPPSTTFSCMQATVAGGSGGSGDAISITSIGGSLDADGQGGLMVNLTETATIDGDTSCTGTASGTLAE